jgi:glycosyltransferase involved in cell wall biosynthesis
MPKISVIIPCYRQAHFLPECIGSLQEQTFCDWEAIVVDDGSPDGTTEVAEAISTVDRRVKLHRKANGGLSSARNAGLAVATGRYIQFLDADDMIFPEKFEADLALLANLNEPAIAVSDYCRFTTEGTFTTSDLCTPRFTPGGDPELELAIRWEIDLSIPIHAALIDAALLHAPPLRFDERMVNHEDWDFWMRLFAKRPPVLFTEKVLAMYRLSEDSMSAQKGPMYEGFVKAIRTRLGDRSLRPEVTAALREKLSLTAHAYGRGWHGFAKRVAESQNFRRCVPWPLQKLLTGSTYETTRAHAADLLVKHGKTTQ